MSVNNNKNINKKNREYWIKRAIQQDKKMEKDLKKLEKQLKKMYVEASVEIKKELAYFYANQSNLTEWQKYRLEGTLNAINNALDNLYHKEEEMLNNRLLASYMDIYNDSIESLGLDTNFFTINQNNAIEVLKTNWSGFTFSEIIWEKHLPTMKTDIKQIIKAGVIRGDSVQDMANKLNDKLNKGYQNAVRLVHTETCWVQSQATLDSYKDADLEEYEITAFLDKKTSKICRSKDGEVVKVKDGIAGSNLPPFH